MKTTLLITLLAMTLMANLFAQNENGIADKLASIRQAAESGDYTAQFELGKLYFEGVEVSKDHKQAYIWLKNAAKHDLPESWAMLGIIYKNGEAVDKNYTEALTLFEKAAKSENATAQYNLGVMHYNGEGVPANVKNAVHWFKLAANQGHYEAQANLGTCYYEGTGVEVNNTEAYFWYSLAAELCPEAKKEEYNFNRDKAKAELKPEQIEAVDVRVMEWVIENMK